ncbi:putative Paxillin [Daphnia magna]|uniref:Putative Paxillin n=1 Tax=Daphnia magna TaxID=35525 RepID=A0A164KVJ4_9CRUS|nr:putative Paxillin [Daphnia magna]
MDRSVYGEGDTSPYGVNYNPFRLTKKDTPAPGYALLADLQTTLHANGANLNDGNETWANDGQHHVTSQSYQYQHGEIDQQVTYANHAEVVASHNHNPPPQRNMRELDTLLDDLNRSRLSAGVSSGSVGRNSSASNSNDGRPSVDALLNELSNAVHNDGSHKGSTGAASSATEELDVLMASLSTFRDCNMLFQGGSFFVHEGMPYCEIHYHAKRGSLCAGCHKPITGRCITAMFKKFHPEHFVCSYCLKQLKKGTFKEQGDKPYCHGCFERLFG